MLLSAGHTSRRRCAAVCFHDEVTFRGTHGLPLLALAGIQDSCNMKFNYFLYGVLIFFVGDRHTRNSGPQPGREEHDRDAGDHSTCSLESGRTVLHRHVRAVWLHSSTTGWLYAAKKTAQRIFKFYLFISSLSCSRASDLCSRANLW